MSFEEERRKDMSDIEKTMDSALGRRIVWRILEQCRVFSTTFSSEPLSMAFNEGQRNVGLVLLSDVMEVAPKKYMIMTMEAQERRRLMTAILDKEREANDE